jgi:hypothetical protein
MSIETFRREGDYWTISYGGVTCRLRDSQGLRYVACLLGQPGMAVASRELRARASRQASADGGRRGSGGGEMTAAALASAPLQAERDRITVTKSIKAALQHIRDNNPALADHLEATIRRGYSCVYRPDPRVPIRWET